MFIPWMGLEKMLQTHSIDAREKKEKKKRKGLLIHAACSVFNDISIVLSDGHSD